MQELIEFLDPDLHLPVRGRLVRIAAPSAWEGLRLRRLMLDGRRLPPREEVDEMRRLLGAAWDRLDADGLDEKLLLHVGRTALMHFAVSEQAGQEQWDPKLAAERRRREAEELANMDSGAPGFMGPTDPGGGPIIDRGSMTREWFNPPHMAPGRSAAISLTWRDVFKCWHDIELDMHEKFGVDMHSGVLHERPLAWLELRIQDLATTAGTRLNRALRPPTPTS